jgi:hypothetical protein
MAARQTKPPLIQFSLQSLLIVTAMVAIALAFIRLAGWKAGVYYCLLVFSVGPWFAYLASECLPIRTRQMRTAAGHMMLLFLFIGTLKLAEWTLPGPIVLLVALAALLLWTPQYMIFFVWRMEEQ